jgi:hypothetical protein
MNALKQQESCSHAFVDIDGTYNLVSNGWPVLIFGTVDLNHKFRCIAVALSSHEDERSFTVAIESISTAISTTAPDCSFKADFTMQDGSLAIYNSTVDSLKPEGVASCWFHVKQAVHKKKNMSSKTKTTASSKQILTVFMQVKLPRIFTMVQHCLWKNGLLKNQ